MGDTTRFGVSLDDNLLNRFDTLCKRRLYPSRSEAIRDMIRETLIQDALQYDSTEAAGVLSLVYDHHVPELSHKLTEHQHDYPELIISTLHIHLDHHNCLEILVLRGKSHEIKNLADKLRAIRGVHSGSLSLTAIKPHHDHKAEED